VSLATNRAAGLLLQQTRTLEQAALNLVKSNDALFRM